MLRPVIRETNAERTDDHIRDMILAALDSPGGFSRVRIAALLPWARETLTWATGHLRSDCILLLLVL